MLNLSALTMLSYRIPHGITFVDATCDQQLPALSKPRSLTSAFTFPFSPLTFRHFHYKRQQHLVYYLVI